MDNISNDSKYTSESFISQLNKIFRLKENNIFSVEEFNNKKIQIIIDLINNGISQSLDDFLSEILILRENNILTVEEIKQIKASLVSKGNKNNDDSSDTEINNSTNDIIICKHCNKVFNKNFTISNQDGIVCKYCGKTNSISIHTKTEANIINDSETTESNIKDINYFCSSCGLQVKLENDEIEKADFICPTCGKLNKLEKDSAKPKQKTNYNKLLIIGGIIFLLFMVIAIKSLFIKGEYEGNKLVGSWGCYQYSIDRSEDFKNIITKDAKDFRLDLLDNGEFIDYVNRADDSKLKEINWIPINDTIFKLNYKSKDGNELFFRYFRILHLNDDKLILGAIGLNSHDFSGFQYKFWYKKISN